MTQVVLGGQHNSLGGGGGLPVGGTISCMTGHSIDSALCPIKVSSGLWHNGRNSFPNYSAAGANYLNTLV